MSDYDSASSISLESERSFDDFIEDAASVEAIDLEEYEAAVQQEEERERYVRMHTASYGDDASAFLSEVTSAIITGDKEEIVRIVQSYEFTFNELDQVVLAAINFCRNQGAVDMAAVLLSEWNRLSTPITGGEVDSRVALAADLDLKLTKFDLGSGLFGQFILSACTDLSFTAVVSNLCGLPASAQLEYATYSLLQIYNVDEDVIELAAQSAATLDNIAVTNALYNLLALANENKTATRPNYLIHGTHTMTPLEEFDLSKVDYNVDAMIRLLSKDIRFPGMLEEDVQNQIRALVQKSDPEELNRLVLASVRKKSLAKNPELARLFGPVNTNSRLDLSSNSVCCRYGGCRLLICNCIEGVNDDFGENIQDADWFTGVCQVCGTNIPTRQYALRKPNRNGGWSGCYCGEKCVRKDPYVEAPIDGPIIDAAMRDLHTTGLYEQVNLDGELTRLQENGTLPARTLFRLSSQ